MIRDVFHVVERQGIGENNDYKCRRHNYPYFCKHIQYEIFHIPGHLRQATGYFSLNLFTIVLKRNNFQLLAIRLHRILFLADCREMSFDG